MDKRNVAEIEPGTWVIYNGKPRLVIQNNPVGKWKRSLILTDPELSYIDAIVYTTQTLTLAPEPVEEMRFRFIRSGEIV